MKLRTSYRYLIGLIVGLTLTFGLAWLYVVTFPMAFMESGYAIWKAKQDFISHCDLGNAIISGDSRAEAAIDPRKLDIPAPNLTFTAETPMEEYFFLRHVAQCYRPPEKIFISLAMPGFTEVSEFLWESDARFGYINYSELEDISSTARTLGDPSVEKVKSRLGFGGKLRNFLYASYFPPLYFNALTASRLSGRYGANQTAYAQTRQMQGHVAYVRNNHVVLGAISGDFRALPVQDAFFQRTLAMLQQRNIQVIFVPMPVSERVERQTPPAADGQFQSYLLGLTRRYPNFHIVRPLVTVWPDKAFQEGVHLEASYVERFTRRFAACEHASAKPAGPVIDCDLSWASASSGDKK